MSDLRLDRMIAEGEMMTPEDRWESGEPHDPRSEEIYRFIEELDWAAGEVFEFKAGGDGDNGEDLMYLLDCYFAHKDKQSADKAGT